MKNWSRISEVVWSAVAARNKPDSCVLDMITCDRLTPVLLFFPLLRDAVELGLLSDLFEDEGLSILCGA